METNHPLLDEHTAAHVAELFRAFSDTSRVRIMSALLDGEKNVGKLAELVGISESAVSHHMRGLRQTRIVTARRDGKDDAKKAVEKKDEEALAFDEKDIAKTEELVGEPTEE